MQTNATSILGCILRGTLPCASAEITGSKEYPDIRGEVHFYPYCGKTLLSVSLEGLPTAKKHPIFGLHIHEGSQCSGNETDPFADAKSHYNPQHTNHPQHAGDLPPIFANDGSAWYALLTDRFNCRAIIGKTVILHEMADDLMTQPSGNAGKKMACGEIRLVRRLYRF